MYVVTLVCHCLPKHRHQRDTRHLVEGLVFEHLMQARPIVGQNENGELLTGGVPSLSVGNIGHGHNQLTDGFTSSPQERLTMDGSIKSRGRRSSAPPENSNTNYVCRIIHLLANWGLLRGKWQPRSQLSVYVS